MVSKDFNNWMNQDPEGARRHLENSTGGEELSDLVVEILQPWIGLVSVEAYTWLGTFPRGESRDQGIDLMFRREFSKDPESLVPWVELILDPNLRARYQRRLGGRAR